METFAVPVGYMFRTPRQVLLLYALLFLRFQDRAVILFFFIFNDDSGGLPVARPLHVIPIIFGWLKVL